MLPLCAVRYYKEGRKVHLILGDVRWQAFHINITVVLSCLPLLLLVFFGFLFRRPFLAILFGCRTLDSLEVLLRGRLQQLLRRAQFVFN
jgi:hypothetical protein